MKTSNVFKAVLGVALVFGGVAAASPGALYEMAADTHTRWASFENLKAEKGAGGQTNNGAKGAAFSLVKAGETKVLMEATGSGTVHRMWFTLRDRSPKALRSYVLRMYWDGADSPAVAVPLGDFFGGILGRLVTFESELFSSPEGRSLNCCIPMPFRKGAKVTFTNESDKDLEQLFYDIDFTLNASHAENALYFHATFRRERWTTLGEDFAILPRLEGAGRFLGCNIGIVGHPDNIGWWGEGEVKMFIDGDGAWPTIVGTGTEDYVGTAYGQGEYANRFQGSLIVDAKRRHYAFYRYHVPDPVFFHEDIKVAIQQMGGANSAEVKKMLAEGVEIKPISVHNEEGFVALNEAGAEMDLADAPIQGGWCNYLRRDDVCAVALFYLDRPENGLPELAPLAKRVEAME